jgi:hypothetical protein
MQTSLRAETTGESLRGDGVTVSGTTRSGTADDFEEIVGGHDSARNAPISSANLRDRPGFGPVVAEKRCEGRFDDAERGRSVEPRARSDFAERIFAITSMERFLCPLGLRREGTVARKENFDAAPTRRLEVGVVSSDERRGVRTVMRTGWLLRTGCAVALMWGAVGTAAAFDPNNGAANEDAAAVLPNVQALAPVPAPGRAGAGAPMVSAPAALTVPPGVSTKLLPGPVVPPTATLSAEEEFRAGTRLYYAGDRKAALEQLRRAGEHGHPIALWKLGKIYETGDGVPVNDAKAVEFYREVIDNHADEARGTPQAAFVASAFVSLGSYYLKGVEKAAIRPNVDRARELYTYAASIFGDTEAQYRLGRLYLEDGGERDPRQAARWLTVAAKKGHCGAQAMLGQLLFNGDEGLPRRPVQGLMWLTIARANANGSGDDWIREVQEQVFSVANESERRRGVADAQDWIARSGN